MQDIKSYAVRCFQDEAQAILDLIPRIDDNFTKAVEMIFNCKGKVIVTGVGKSGHVGEKMASTLASLGTPSFFLNPLDAFHGDLGMISEGDVVISISYSGYYGRDYKDRSFITRAPNIGNPDIILVFGATNDDWAGAPLGTLKYEDWTEEDLYSFCPAMTYLANFLTKNHPKANIYFIVNDCLKPEITETIHEVCNHYGISVVELKNIAKKTSHPTIAGMKQIADQVGNALNSKE